MRRHAKAAPCWNKFPGNALNGNPNQIPDKGGSMEATMTGLQLHDSFEPYYAGRETLESEAKADTRTEPYSNPTLPPAIRKRLVERARKPVRPQKLPIA